MSPTGSALRIGVFGGAFDPPHNAHVALAEAALVQLDLTELHVIPTGQAWHKSRTLTPKEDRLAMTRLAFGNLQGKVVIDSREVLRDGPTYTLDTLHELQKEQPGAQLVLVMGADQAAALPTWHGWQDILGIAIVSVAYRALSTGDVTRFDPKQLPGLPVGARFEALELPAAMDTSATDIRRRVASGVDISSLVPPTVARYIDQHHLYRSA
ncbi:nicotinate-nucleotide adenylyltransferase [Variovorax boronicumulans]|uniref:Probable nicotinate-nucleotide adenylyltransferase n=1 Tax=Variovorax boronicumulans TaxID=436515 RepID=A0AAW8DQ99_9BURK|nr:nicotinate (nicotinamide) nucleotide adenylyltransferase [Variovorax boronicumulans]MDP9876406.1 nicotinate-nucleotide adenylyltransferase [Variovorax boronicumulans]MDP9921690.1 nicotinate-nucleotide adenylyltransferase [Variovorax boronicumulans]